MGKLLIIVGLVLAVIGLLLVLGERLPLKLGRLPGDIVIRGKNTTFYFPLATLILVNLAIAVVIWLVNRR